MNRLIALRASICFVLLALPFGAVGFASQVPLAAALFAISFSLCVLMLTFALAVPARAPVPVLARSRRMRRH